MPHRSEATRIDARLARLLDVEQRLEARVRACEQGANARVAAARASAERAEAEARAEIEIAAANEAREEETKHEAAIHGLQDESRARVALLEDLADDAIDRLAQRAMDVLLGAAERP
jgi:hypothetical protein